MSSEHKKKFLGIIDWAVSSNSAAQQETQQHLQNITRDGEMLHAVRNVVKNLPDDDSVLPETEWTNLEQDYTELAKRMIAYKMALSNAAPLVSATSASASMTTTAATRILSNSTVRKVIPKADIEHLEQVLARPSLFGEVIERMERFHLHEGLPNVRSPVKLLSEAHDALTKPSGSEPGTTAVLITARAALEETLNRLIKRLPQQEKTGGAGGKVAVLGKQCGIAGITEDEFVRLGSQIAALVNTLSSAKDNIYSDLDVRRLFTQTLYAIQALLIRLDFQQFR